MPTIVYYPEPIAVEISMEEFMRRESAPVRIHEETGRMARRAIAEYDECFAELSAEKQNRREKFLRTHKVRNDGKSVSKDKGRKYIKEMEYRLDPWVNKNGCEMVSHYRSMVAEKSVREDWDAEQNDIYAEIYEDEYLKEQIEQAKQYMSSTVQRIDHRVNQYAEIVSKLLKLEDPTDWESLNAYRDAIDTAEWYVFD